MTATSLTVDLTGAEILWPDDTLAPGVLSLAEGRIQADRAGRLVDLSGCRVLPGIVDAHGDGFERHVAPRRGAMTDVARGIEDAAAELAANGVTTAVMAQFVSWEGGLRGPEFADAVFRAMRDAESPVELVPQVRFETHLLDLYDALPQMLHEWCASYIVFNDHLQHDRLAQGRKPRHLTGQALKSGRSPEVHWAYMQDLHARHADIPAALDTLCARLSEQGILMGSHDDRTGSDRETWLKRGVSIAEFPETLDAAAAPGAVVMGAPNVMRGASHKGNVAAREVVEAGLCDALASDYHYPSLRRAAFDLSATIGLAAAWRLISAGPAELLGLGDRGRLAPGLRADVTILDPRGRVGATLVAGRVAFASGEVAARLFARG